MSILLAMFYFICCSSHISAIFWIMSFCDFIFSIIVIHNFQEKDFALEYI